jgi:hypothetical protein
MSLALDAAHALLTLDGRERATAPRSAGPPTAAAVTFGARSKASSQASGYLDIDDVSVRSAPD